jgi:Fe-S-cluster containining protein
VTAGDETDGGFEGPEAFFRAQRDNFFKVLQQGRGDPRLIDALTSQAFDNFERNAALQGEGQPEPACCRGCDTCCCLHVSATAPEIFLAARFLRLTAAAFAAHGVDFRQRLTASHAATEGLSQAQRFASRQICPFIIGGACAIYSVRTLACRGHVAFDREACLAAAAGQDVEVPASASHRAVRALVQNALQAALRDAGLDWGVSEFLAGLDRAMQDDSSEARWLRGEAVFADLRQDGDVAEDMAETFDALKN